MMLGGWTMDTEERESQERNGKSNREQQGATGGNKIGRENQQSRISDQSPKI
jgi:hypothetical protein